MSKSWSEVIENIDLSTKPLREPRKLSCDEITDLKEKCNPKYDLTILDLICTIEALQQENEQLRAQVGKPTIEQVAWIAKCICQNADEQGTFRHLIYDIMGYGGEAYQPLCEAGLLRINNSMIELTPEQVEALQQENEQLRAKLEDWKYEVKCHMDEVIAREKQIEQLRVRVTRMRELLTKTYDEIGQTLAEIDKVLGGKNDGKTDI